MVVNCLTVAVLSFLCALSDERSGLFLLVIFKSLGQYVHELFTVFMFHMYNIYNIYNIYTSPCQSRLGTTDYALLVVAKATTALLDT
jgi:hypothetical protein